MKRIDAVFLSIILIVSGFYVGTNYASSFTGVSKTMGDDFIEVDAINATKYYLDDTNITARLEGNWDTDVNVTGYVDADTYHLDGTNLTDRLEGDWGSTNLTTTGAVSTADLNFTSEFYYNDENRTDTFANPDQIYSLLIWKEGSTYKAKNGTTGQIEYSSANALTTLQWGVYNVPSGSSKGGTIFVKSPYYATGELIVNRSDLVIETDGIAHYSDEDKVWIKQMTFNSSDGYVQAVRIQGVWTGMITFYAANSNLLQDIYFEHCKVESSRSTTTEGIVFDGDGTVASHNIYFRDGNFYDIGQSARKGFISFVDWHSGTGQIYIQRCHYSLSATYHENHAFIAFEDEGYCSPSIIVDSCDFTMSGGGVDNFNFTRVYNQTNPAKKGGFYSLLVINNWFEIHEDMTLFAIDASSEDVHFGATFKNNWLSDSAGETTTIITNLNDNFRSGMADGLIYRDNFPIGEGEVAIGTPNESSSFFVQIESPEIGWNVKEIWLPVQGTDMYGGVYKGENFTDGVDKTYYMPTMYVPNTCYEFYDMDFVMISGGTGDIYWEAGATFAKENQAYNTHTDTRAFSLFAGDADVLEYIYAGNAVEGVAKHDSIAIWFRRDASDILDTMGDTMTLLGVRIRYREYIPSSQTGN